MRLFELHFSRTWGNLQLNPFNNSNIDTFKNRIINCHIYCFDDLDLYKNLRVFILIVSMYAVCYMFFLTLLPRDYAHYARVSFSKYLSYIICCTLCCYFPDLLDKKSLNEHYTLTEKCRFKMMDPVCTTYYSDMARVGRPSIDPVFILPVTATYSNRDKASNTYSNNTNKCTELSIQDETQIEETINVDSFTTHELSVLNKIDPDINYLNTQTIINNTKYYTEHPFRKKKNR